MMSASDGLPSATDPSPAASGSGGGLGTAGTAISCAALQAPYVIAGKFPADAENGAAGGAMATDFHDFSFPWY